MSESQVARHGDNRERDRIAAARFLPLSQSSHRACREGPGRNGAGTPQITDLGAAQVVN